MLRTALAPSVTFLLVLRSDRWMFQYHRQRCTFALVFGLALRMLRLSPGPLSSPPGIVLFCARLSLGLNLLHELALFITNGVMYNNETLPATAAAALGNCCAVGLLTLALAFITDAVVAQPAVWLVAQFVALPSHIRNLVMACCRRPPPAVASHDDGAAAKATAVLENAQTSDASAARTILEESPTPAKVASSGESPPKTKGTPSEESPRQAKGKQSRGKSRAERAKQQS